MTSYFFFGAFFGASFFVSFLGAAFDVPQPFTPHAIVSPPLLEAIISKSGWLVNGIVKGRVIARPFRSSEAKEAGKSSFCLSNESLNGLVGSKFELLLVL